MPTHRYSEGVHERIHIPPHVSHVHRRQLVRSPRGEVLPKAERANLAIILSLRGKWFKAKKKLGRATNKFLVAKFFFLTFLRRFRFSVSLGLRFAFSPKSGYISLTWILSLTYRILSPKTQPNPAQIPSFSHKN